MGGGVDAVADDPALFIHEIIDHLSLGRVKGAIVEVAFE